MAKPVVKRFVLNDETVANTYGFYISTSGIDLSRFEKNPVMLSSHWNDNAAVLGKWIDLQKTGSTLSGLPDFDLEDEAVKPIAGKVMRGYINGCSMGILFNREDMLMLDGKIFLTKCQLAEVSIVPVPSNANAVRLMYENGTELKEEEIKSLCLSIAPKAKEFEIKPNTNMKKIILSVAALMALSYKDQPADGIEVADVESKILELSGQLSQLKSENASLKLAAQQAKEAQEAALKQNATTDVEQAIAEGKITADKKEAFVQLGITNPEVLKATLSAIPAKQNFGAGIHPQSGTGVVEVKTKEDFLKLGLAAQLAFKNENAEAYKKLFS
jgi:hypothetical protein